MSASHTDLKKTPLYDLHKELDAKMVEFAGYSMPVQYADGVLKEHLHTRELAGLFDVSHMGQLVLSGKDPAAALEALVPGDIIGLGVNKQRYTLLTNAQGGVIDDLMVVNRGADLFLVVNAACKTADIEHLRSHLPADVSLQELENRALLALQGPKAAEVVSELTGGQSDAMIFMDYAELSIDGLACQVTRSGYTGEDGFEISVSAEGANDLAKRLLQFDAVKMIGLGARDSLRLEAGLCLYGHELNLTTSPIEASLQWAIPKVRRQGGEREGGFLGSDTILNQLEAGVEKKRVGIRPQGRAPIRDGVEIVDAEDRVVGEVCSGGFGPSVGGPIAMAYVELANASNGQELHALVRGKKLPVTVSSPQFVESRYYRGK